MRRFSRKRAGGERTGQARGASRLRAIIFGLVAFLLAFQDVALASSFASAATRDGSADVFTAAGVDCAQRNPDLPPGDRRTHDCLQAGLCCVAGCEGQAPIGLAGIASFEIPWAELPSGAIGRNTPAHEGIGLTGWASAWSSRAPPRAF